MYEPYFGLRERPFDLTPDPRYLFLTPGHREALTNLQYGIRGSRGITLLLGEAGTGKTTLVQRALASGSDERNRHVYVNNPALTRREFLELLSISFQLSRDAMFSKTRLLLELQQLLAAQPATGVALVVDEAQSLPDDLLEEIRLLANIETPARKLPVILAGQPELGDRLNQVSLRQLKQRVALRCVLAPLTFRETAIYIDRRIRTAGGDAAACFTDEAVATIHERSNGIPRVISVICDNALISGFAADCRPVGRQIVLEVCRDFDFVAGGAAPAVTTGASEAREPDETPPVVGVLATAAATAGSNGSAVDRGHRPAGELFGHFSRQKRFLFF